jgi:amino acid transporter
MKKNMGSIDRTVRVIAAIVIGILYFTGQITGTASIILGILAIIFVLTSIVGLCPLYILLKLSTLKKKAV